MRAEGLVEGMTGAFQTTTTDNICLVINSDASGEGTRPALSPSYVSGLTDLLQAFRLEPDKAPCAVILSGAEASSSSQEGSALALIWGCCIKWPAGIMRHGGHLLTE